MNAMKQISRVDYAGESGERIGLGVAFLLFIWCLIMSFSLTGEEESAIQKENPAEVVRTVGLTDY